MSGRSLRHAANMASCSARSAAATPAPHLVELLDGGQPGVQFAQQVDAGDAADVERPEPRGEIRQAVALQHPEPLETVDTAIDTQRREGSRGVQARRRPPPAHLESPFAEEGGDLAEGRRRRTRAATRVRSEPAEHRRWPTEPQPTGGRAHVERERGTPVAGGVESSDGGAREDEGTLQGEDEVPRVHAPGCRSNPDVMFVPPAQGRGELSDRGILRHAAAHLAEHAR